MRIPLSEAMRERVLRTEIPAVPKHAATIAVVRDGEAGIEAFLMRRQASMAFAAGMYVFPGGGVHEEDAVPLPWAGPEAGHFAERFGCSPELAHSLVVAAARETFEETGVLLAGPDASSVVADVTEFHDARAALENHEFSFAQFLTQHNLVLRADLLGAWAHWITPKIEPRRYDTKFFVATLPEGQRIDSVSSEADHSMWAPISEVLASVTRGDAAMMPPTVVTCRELSIESSQSVLAAAARRQIVTIEPQLVEIDGDFWLETQEVQS